MLLARNARAMRKVTGRTYITTPYNTNYDTRFAFKFKHASMYGFNQPQQDWKDTIPEFSKDEHYANSTFALSYGIWNMYRYPSKILFFVILKFLKDFFVNL